MIKRGLTILTSVLTFVFVSVSVVAMPIDELRVSGPCDVTLVCSSDSAGFVFPAPDTAEDCGLDIRRAEGALYLTVDPSKNKRVSVKVYADEQIDVIMASKRSTVTAQDFKSQHTMSLSVTTAASMNLRNLTAKYINVSVAGAGKVDMTDDIAASVVNLSLVGSGTINLAGLAASSLTITQRGSGKIAVAGSARKCSAVAFGTGLVVVSKLVSDEMDLKLFGTGKIFYPAGVRAKLDGETENIKSVKPYQPL